VITELRYFRKEEHQRREKTEERGNIREILHKREREITLERENK